MLTPGIGEARQASVIGRIAKSLAMEYGKIVTYKTPDE